MMVSQIKAINVVTSIASIVRTIKRVYRVDRTIIKTKRLLETMFLTAITGTK
jgi:hypothetical protein